MAFHIGDKQIGAGLEKLVRVGNWLRKWLKLAIKLEVTWVSAYLMKVSAFQKQTDYE